MVSFYKFQPNKFETVIITKLILWFTRVKRSGTFSKVVGHQDGPLLQVLGNFGNFQTPPNPRGPPYVKLQIRAKKIPLEIHIGHCTYFPRHLCRETKQQFHFANFLTGKSSIKSRLRKFFSEIKKSFLKHLDIF